MQSAPNELVTIDPDTGAEPGTGADSGSADGEPVVRTRRKRADAGQPRGKRGAAGSKSAAAALDIDGVTGLLLSIHVMLATVTQSPEFVLADQEARQIAEAAARVGKHYDLTASAKAVDWAGLVMACAAVYGPRIAILRHRKHYEAQHAAQQASGGVVVHPDFGTS